MLLFAVHPASTGSAVDTAPLQTVAVIPARFGSTRFPGKPLAEIDCLPIIEHVYLRANRAKRLSRVIVATDAPLLPGQCDRVQLAGQSAR